MATAGDTSRDLSVVPKFSFSDVESYAKEKNKASGDKHLSKGVKYYSEKYITSIKGELFVRWKAMLHLDPDETAFCIYYKEQEKKFGAPGVIKPFKSHSLGFYDY